MVKPTNMKHLHIMAENPSIYSVEDLYDIINRYIRTDNNIKFSDFKKVVDGIPYNKEIFVLIIEELEKKKKVIKEFTDKIEDYSDPTFIHLGLLFEEYRDASNYLSKVIKSKE